MSRLLSDHGLDVRHVVLWPVTSWANCLPYFWVRGALAVLVAAPGLAQAEPPPADAAAADEIETLVVTGFRQPRLPAVLPNDLDVISGAELRAARYDGVIEALRHRPDRGCEGIDAHGRRR